MLPFSIKQDLNKIQDSTDILVLFVLLDAHNVVVKTTLMETWVYKYHYKTMALMIETKSWPWQSKTESRPTPAYDTLQEISANRYEIHTVQGKSRSKLMDGLVFGVGGRVGGIFF